MRGLSKVLSILLLLTGITGLANAFAPQSTIEKSTIRLRWKTSAIPIAISNSLLQQSLNIKADSDVSGAINRSLETWENAANIKFERTSSEKLSVSANGNFGDGISLITIAQTPENLLMFSKDSEQVSARTRVFFNKKGLITEADIVLNPYQQFSTDGSIGTFDLEATLTHEIGHLLGLEHSAVYGAIMHENSSKNGVFYLPGNVTRTLAQTDISAVRAIYGTNSEETTCCGAVAGKLILPSNKVTKSFQVWAEDSLSGKVVGEAFTNADGIFQIGGLENGKYHLYSQELSFSKSATSANDLGLVEIEKGKTFNLTKKIEFNAKPFDLQYVGFNGQIAELAVPLNGGKSYILYIGGKNLDPDKIKIGFNSDSLQVTPNSINKQDFGEEISVLSFEVKVSKKSNFGEYSIFVESANQVKEYIVGGLTIGNFSNLQSSFTFSGS